MIMRVADGASRDPDWNWEMALSSRVRVFCPRRPLLTSIDIVRPLR